MITGRIGRGRIGAPSTGRRRIRAGRRRGLVLRMDSADLFRPAPDGRFPGPFGRPARPVPQTPCRRFAVTPFPWPCKYEQVRCHRHDRGGGGRRGCCETCARVLVDSWTKCVTCVCGAVNGGLGKAAAGNDLHQARLSRPSSRRRQSLSGIDRRAIVLLWDSALCIAACFESCRAGVSVVTSLFPTGQRGACNTVPSHFLEGYVSVGSHLSPRNCRLDAS